MVALIASLLFTVAFLGSLTVIAAMLNAKRDDILSALSGKHLPASVHAPVIVHAPRHRLRTVRRLAPPPSPVQIRRAAFG